MGMYLNSIASYAKYKAMVCSPYFVDKTELLTELIPLIGRESPYVCITRPRRFGKTVMANMIGAFFGKSADSRSIFEHLNISGAEGYKRYINKYDIIYIDFSEVPEECSSYKQYITRIIEGLKTDLLEEYPELNLSAEKSVWDILLMIFEKKGGQKFIFVLDEWDALFHMPFIEKRDRSAYLLFLKSLLKSKAYVELAYMTGILPISKYSGGSELNMFAEYNMATMELYSEYFGFTDKEVDCIYTKYRRDSKDAKVSREGLKLWYDGYHTAAGQRLYNPRSVVFALQNNQLSNYWTGSGPYDEIFYYIQNNIEDVKDDIALMVSGEHVEAKVQEYAATATELESKDQIYSAMVVYGLLTYEKGEVFIPNMELMGKFEELLQTKSSLGYIYQLAKASNRMLKATLNDDTKTMAEILSYAHDTETPLLAYNNEAELSAVVNLVYLSARDKYWVEREDKAGIGYVDFIFYPIRADDDCIILELKVDHTPEEAIAQIKDKKYSLRFKGKLGEKPKYTGRVLAVGIGYSKEKKIHECKIEVLG